MGISNSTKFIDGSGEQGKDRFGITVESATEWAHLAGSRLAVARGFLETHALGQRPVATLGVFFGLGVLTGWLVKRR